MCIYIYVYRYYGGISGLKQPKWCYTQDIHDDIRFIDDDNDLCSQPTQKIMFWGIRNHQLGMKHRL